jgi:serine/threonine protein kinase
MPVLKNGTLLGDYAIVGLIARGGMGEVYEAHENKLDRRVALKVVLQDTSDHESEDLVKRFMQEARTLAKVNHPNIVTIHSIQQIDNLQFIAMEFVEGVSLKQFLDEYAMPLEVGLFLFEQILSGLKRLHDHGIVHRDLKPSNILIRMDGQVKILDFGIAKSSDTLHNTNPGVTVGTPPYMAPEMRSFRGSTLRSDFWSLGAIFFECLTGKLLVMFMEGDQFKFQPSDLKIIPPEMRAIINGMSAPEPEDRYRNANEIIDDLHRLRESVGAASPSAMATFRDQLRHLTEARRTKDKSVVRQITVPKFDIDLGTRGSERMESSIRKFDSMPHPPSKKAAKVPESRSAQRKRRNRKYIAASVMGVLAAALYISPVFDRYAIRSPLRRPAQAPPQVQVPAPPAAPAPAVRLLEPTDRQQVWLEPGQNPTLSWSHVLAGQEFDIQLALDVEFKKIILNESVSGNSHLPTKIMPDGIYYWRLVPSAANRRSGATAPQTFTLSRLEPVILVKPLVEEKVETVSSDGAPADFEWACRTGARQYNVQVAHDSAFKNVAVSKVVPECRWGGVRLKPGRYYWRVRLELGPGYREIWSSSRPFAVVTSGKRAAKKEPRKVERAAKLQAPKLKSPNQTVFLSTPGRRGPASRNVEKVVDLTWRAVPGARNYHLQLSYSKDLGGPVVDETVSGSSFRWKASAPGTFYWRVRAADAMGGVGPQSGLGQIKVMLPAPVIKPSYSFNIPDTSPTVEWRSLPLTPQYLVQFGSKRDLSSVRAKVMDQPRFTAPATAGTYFLRIAAADVGGLATSPYSNVASIKILHKARAPQAEIPAFEAPKPVSPISGAMAPSKGGRISIEFQWTPVIKAESYSLELATDSSFTEIVERTNSGEPRTLLEQVPVKGRVYWRVKARGGGRASSWSESFYFDVR